MERNGKRTAITAKCEACNPQSAGANADALREAGAAQIIGVDNRENWIACEQVEGDLYRILEGKPQAVRRYAVEYLRRFFAGGGDERAFGAHDRLVQQSGRSRRTSANAPDAFQIENTSTGQGGIFK